MTSLPGIVLCLVAFPIFHASGKDWFAAPGGSPDAGGTAGDPLDLESALSADRIRPGDTLLLKAGVYRHPDRRGSSLGFSLGLRGSPERPILVRNVPGERVTLDGGLQTANAPTPRHVLIQGLEILVGELERREDRTTGIPGSHPDLGCPRGGVTLKEGSDLKVINCVIRANGNGVGFWRTVGGDSEVYGNIIHDNGWTGPDRKHGHGIYTQNLPEHRKRIENNLILDNYGRCVQAYGSARTRVENYLFEGNYFASRERVSNVLFGGTHPACGNRKADFRNNLFYQATLSIGYNCPAHEVRLEGNRFLRGSFSIRDGSTGIIEEGNRIWRREHPRDPVPGDVVFLRGNRYDPGRLHLVLIQPTRSSEEMTVDFGDFLKPGDGVRIQNARDFFGEPVRRFVYSGEPARVPVGGREESAFVVLIEQKGK